MSNKMKFNLTHALIYFLVLVSIQVLANTNDIINQQTEHRNAIQKQYSGKFNKLKVDSYKKTLNYSPIVSNIKKEQIAKFPGSFGHAFVKQAPLAIVFVSFSMPKTTLELTMKEARRYNISVVMRGLYKNSFKKTARKMFDMVKANNKGGILINPLWFRKFHIKTVPALVIQKSGGSGIYDVVYGNVTIKRGLEIIAANGDVASVAKNILGDG